MLLIFWKAVVYVYKCHTTGYSNTGTITFCCLWQCKPLSLCPTPNLRGGWCCSKALFKIMRVFHSQKCLSGCSLYICILSVRIVCVSVWDHVLPVKLQESGRVIGVGVQVKSPPRGVLAALRPLPDTDHFSFPYPPHFPTWPASTADCLPFLPLFYLIALEMSLCCSPRLCEPPETSMSLMLQAKYQWAALLERGEQGKHGPRGLGHWVQLKAKQMGWSDVWVMLFVRPSQLLSAK